MKFQVAVCWLVALCSDVCCSWQSHNGL